MGFRDDVNKIDPQHPDFDLEKFHCENAFSKNLKPIGTEEYVVLYAGSIAPNQERILNMMYDRGYELIMASGNTLYFKRIHDKV